MAKTNRLMSVFLMMLIAQIYNGSSVKRSRFEPKKVSFEEAQLNYLENGEVLPY